MFKNLKVIELASVLAGPSVGQFFAELGAEVVKVENPATGGDVTRSWFFKGEAKELGVSSYFSSVNWGKKSVLLNLSSSKDQELLYALVKEADIVIASYKPGDAEKLGVDYDTLSRINSTLIYGHITGYGPSDQRVGYDAVIQAESGFMSINGMSDGGALKMPVALMDVLAGHHLKQGLLVALIGRSTSGRGSYVPVSLIEAAVSSLANQAANWLVGGKVPVRMGNHHPNIAPYGDVFDCEDGKQIILAVGNDKQFCGLNEVLGLKLHIDADYITNSGRVAHRAALYEVLAKKIVAFTSDDLQTRLQAKKVPVGAIKSIDQVFTEGSDDWLHLSGQLSGVKSFMAMPQDFEVPHKLTEPPALGAHTREVLEGLTNT